ncbi:hypothetical protein J2X36_000997 [Methylobacterium sp. BE186]|jgi:hypothetical protein|uniref:hypothetical protein n=1 Tax=Methylobacterium sp. BE186 TaxID=2817715 RepID=UPI0028665ECD|nr:hypothetical protein [Methylobacterium sp. BE186]MDR7036259.1 hypothetical protein [Methylobacterium sp. BE186]
MTAPVTRLTSLLVALAGTLFAAPAEAGGCYGSECYRRVTTPAVYDTVSEQVLVRPPRTIYRTTPPVFDTVSERVLVAPGGRVWQTRRGPYGDLIGCWVTTPPQYAVRQRRVLVQPPQSIPETIPPEYASVSRRVLVQPARAGWVPVGGGYGPGPAYGPGIGGPLVGSIPDAFGITGASSADIGVGLGFSSGSIYDGY